MYSTLHLHGMYCIYMLYTVYVICGMRHMLIYMVYTVSTCYIQNMLYTVSNAVSIGYTLYLHGSW